MQNSVDSRISEQSGNSTEKEKKKEESTKK
jgi:hypothetical protein